MVETISIRNAAGTWTVRAGGAVLAETTNALEVSEIGHPPRIYFPRDDVAMAFLDRTDQVTTSPLLGQANFFSIAAKNRVIENAGWTYEAPKAGMEALAGHIAFYEGEYLQVEKV